MATTTTTIKVTADTRDAQRALGDLQNSLGRLATVGAVGALTKSFSDFADEVTNLNNRLRTISTTNSEVAARFQTVLNIANATRTPLAAIGDLYYGLAAAAKDAGATQEDVVLITEKVAKSLAASGTSATQAAGSLLQLKQAFQSGRFQGDELRSILEGMPQVAQAMADKFGVTVGALRYLGSQGKITSADFVEAMRAAGASIDAAFGRTVPTISQSFTVLRNNFLNLVGEFDRQTGASEGLSRAIMSIADSLKGLNNNIDTIVGAFKILGAIATLVIGSKIAGAIKGAQLAGTALSAVFTRLAYVIKDAGGIAGIFATVVGLIANAWKSLVTQVTGRAQAFTGVFDFINRAVFLTLAFFTKIGEYLTRNLWPAISLTFAGWLGFLDPVVEGLKSAVNYMAKLVGMGPAFEKSQPQYNFPDTAGAGRGNGQAQLLAYQNLQAEEIKKKTEAQIKLEKAVADATQTRNEALKGIVRDQTQALALSRLEGVELTIQQGIFQANNQLVKEIKDEFGKIIGYTQGLNAEEERRLRTLILQVAQQQLQREVARDLKSAQEDLSFYQTRGLGMSQSQLAIESRVAEFRRNNVGLATEELQAQVRAAEVARQRLSMEQEINTAFRAANDNLGFYKSNITGMTSTQLDTEMKILEAQRRYGDLLTDELKQKIRSTDESEKQLDYLRQMKQGVEAVLKVQTGAQAGAMAAGQLGNLLPVDAALTAQQSLMNGLQELRNRDLINEQQYQDAKVAANAQAMAAMYDATKKKFEGEQTLRIQALVGDKFSFDTIKSMASDAAAFQMKTDMEKWQFGIDQAASMFSELGKQNKRAFEAAKAFNIANAVMNTYMAATKALATYPFPFGMIAAGAAIAAGFAQVAAIRAQTYSGRALGGPVMANESYIVGERGPEVFTPATSGRITRNDQIGAGGQPVTVNFNINTVDASGFDTLLVQRRGLITSMIADAQLERGRRG